MIKDKEIRDDWLYQEIKRESKFSAWDFDEGSKVKRAHEEHCAAENVRKEHAMVHKAPVNRQTVNQDISSKRFLVIVITMIFVIAVFIFITISNFIDGNFEFFGALPIFAFVMFAVVGSLVSSKKGK